ncbi:MAG TPA: hypothetical protein VMF70_12965 [Gemmatimonadales bacterium]|nr:hypothetical protein [Gemmatimonadales bacterium]
MTRLRAIGLFALLMVATAVRLPGQTSAAEILQHAVSLYENVEIESALALLRQIVAPGTPLEVTPEQRAQAYEYMGAVYSLQPGSEKRDTALGYFRDAIAQDPAVSLDPASFTPAQLALFAEARNRTFAVAVRPLRPDTLDSGAVLTFQCVTSHEAALHAELRSDTATLLVLYEGAGDGVRAVTWDGTLPGQSPAPPGRYAMALTARSSILSLTDSAVVYFDLLLDHAPLEDTLPELGPQDLLPEVDENRRSIPANEVENQRRQAERAATNAAIVERNAEAMRRSRLVIAPVAVAGP